MFWIILAVTGGIVLGISYLFYTKVEWRGLEVGDFILSVIIAAIGIVLLLGVSIFPNYIVKATLDNNDKHYEYVVVDEKPLIALKDNIKRKGSFFLGCGNFKDELRYYFIVEDEFGMKPETIPVEMEQLRIKYVDSGDYTQQTYSLQTKTKIAYWLGYPMIDADMVVFNVPPGSVYEGYEIDLE